MTSIAQVDASQWLQDLGQTVVSVLPALLVFLLILIVGYFIAKAVAKILDRVLGRVGFDRVVERGGIGRAMERTKYDASDILGRIVFYALMLVVLQLAFGVFGPNAISELIFGIIAFLPRIFVAVVIVVVAAAIAAAVKEIVEASIGGLSYGRPLAMAASGAILVVGVFAALNQLQIAPQIVNALFYAVLAIIAGSAIVAIGGGGIGPMRVQWEKALQRVEREAPQVRESAQGSQDRIARRAEERREQVTADRAQQTPAGPGAGTTRTRSDDTMSLSREQDETVALPHEENRARRPR
ncbi:MAG: hypothetical protein GEU81_10650 [Nitriliruptorales bacterium]|nr:hypothetical protein [Nitriliruptorales bacterium]